MFPERAPVDDSVVAFPSFLPPGKAINIVLESYIRALIAKVGTGLWLPMRDTTGNIARNYAYQQFTPDAPGANIIPNPTFTGNPPPPWQEFESGGGLVNFLNPGAQVAAATGTGSVFQNPVTILGDTYLITVDISAFTGPGSPRIRTGGGAGASNSATFPSSVGVHQATVLSDSPLLQLFNLGSTTFSVASLTAQKIGELDAAIAGTTTLGQAGIRGTNEAFLFDGATSLLTIYNRASIQGMTAFTVWLLFRPTSAGEGNAGVLFSKSGELELRFNSASRDLIATVNYGTTNAVRVTNETLSLNEYHTVGMRINNTDKVPEVFIDGVQATYASSTAGVGTRVSNTNNLIIGNNAAVSGTLAGQVDEALVANVALTDGELNYLHALTGA